MPKPISQYIIHLLNHREDALKAYVHHIGMVNPYAYAVSFRFGYRDNEIRVTWIEEGYLRDTEHIRFFRIKDFDRWFNMYQQPTKEVIVSGLDAAYNETAEVIEIQDSSNFYHVYFLINGNWVFAQEKRFEGYSHWYATASVQNVTEITDYKVIEVYDHNQPQPVPVDTDHAHETALLIENTAKTYAIHLSSPRAKDNGPIAALNAYISWVSAGGSLILKKPAILKHYERLTPIQQYMVQDEIRYVARQYADDFMKECLRRAGSGSLIFCEDCHHYVDMDTSSPLCEDGHHEPLTNLIDELAKSYKNNA